MVREGRNNVGGGLCQQAVVDFIVKRGNRALKYSRAGKLLGVLNPTAGGKPLLSCPMGIAVEKKGRDIYVVDCHHHRMCKVSKKDFR
jgi:hypothetical protein